MHSPEAVYEEVDDGPSFVKRRRHGLLTHLTNCLLSCCLALGVNCLGSPRKDAHQQGGNSRQENKATLVYGSSSELSDSFEFTSEGREATVKSPLSENSRTELFVICSRCSTRVSQASIPAPIKSPDLDEPPELLHLNFDEDEVFSSHHLEQSPPPKPLRSLSTPTPSVGRISLSLGKITKKSAGDVPNSNSCELRAFGVSNYFGTVKNCCSRAGSRSSPISPTMVTGRGPGRAHPSPSNYCRVKRCEQLHLHDLTPKCLETFAPSSTLSSCQTCERPHIGPNHDQVLLVSQLLKPISTPIPSPEPTEGGPPPGPVKHHISNLLMQWPPPEYRPQHSPDHLYKSFGY